jgi:hypothetical protein
MQRKTHNAKQSRTHALAPPRYTKTIPQKKQKYPKNAKENTRTTHNAGRSRRRAVALQYTHKQIPNKIQGMTHNAEPLRTRSVAPRYTQNQSPTQSTQTPKKYTNNSQCRTVAHAFCCTSAHDLCAFMEETTRVMQPNVSRRARTSSLTCARRDTASHALL